MDLPVARVVLDVPLPHLDRPFDYLVPAALDEAAQPGVRVRVRFAGQLVGGFVTERLADLRARRPAVAPWPRSSPPSRCSAPASLGLARAVADRYAGTLADVLRLAVPPRHARVEAQPTPRTPHRRRPPAPGTGPVGRPTTTGPACSRPWPPAGAPRAVWTALPGPDWPAAVAVAVAATLAGGRGALVVLARRP